MIHIRSEGQWTSDDDTTAPLFVIPYEMVVMVFIEMLNEAHDMTTRAKKKLLDKFIVAAVDVMVHTYLLLVVAC